DAVLSIIERKQNLLYEAETTNDKFPEWRRSANRNEQMAPWVGSLPISLLSNSSTSSAAGGLAARDYERIELTNRRPPISVALPTRVRRTRSRDRGTILHTD